MGIKLQSMDIDDLGKIDAVLLRTMVWKDPRLSWIAEDYGGIKSIIMDPFFIWIPDITLYNR